MTTRTIVLTSPILVFVFSALFERRIGRIYYAGTDDDTLPWWYPLAVQPLLHLVISDLTFYM